MAMGRRGQDEAERAFRCHSRYTNSTGSLTATPGGARELGWLRNHPEADRIKDLLSRAEYVVWSYGTPIGFVCPDDDGDIQRFYVDAQHTTTTSHHQTLLRTAWGEYETIGERRSNRVRRQPAPRVRTSGDQVRTNFSAQDDLMDEVRGWRSPSHP
jgi:hypothetical protein